MKTMMARLTLIGFSAASIAGCASFEGFDRDDYPRADELGPNDCYQSGPHDPTAPGEWICPDETGHDRVQPHHRVEDRD